MTKEGDNSNKDTEKGKDNKDAKAEAEDPETISLSKEEFATLQSQILDLQKEAEESKAEKDKMQRDHVFSELKRVNSKLAKNNEKANLSTLEVVLETAKSMKGSFANLTMDENETSKKEGVAGYRLMGTDEWIQKTE